MNKRTIEQFNFFNWLSNVKNLVPSNSSKHARNVFQWHKISCFSKNSPAFGGFAPRPPKPPTAGSSAPRPPFVIRLSYISLLNTSPNLDILTFNFGDTRTTLLVFHSMISLSHKNSCFKNSDDVIACDLWFAPPHPQSKILATSMPGNG